MKIPALIPKSILLLVASTTLTFSFQSQSQAQLIGKIKIPCIFFCQETQFGGTTPRPTETTTPPPVNNSSKKIFIDNRTGRKILVQAVLHINGKLQRSPEKNLVWIVEPKQKTLIIEIDGNKDKITDSDIWLNIANEKGKLWDKDSKYFITTEDSESPPYFIEALGNNPDFIYTVEEKLPPPNPWIFPILP